MTTRTWNGTTGTFDTAADWSGGLVPVAGDVAVINAGQVTASGVLPTPLTVQVDGAQGAFLYLNQATLGAGSKIMVNDETARATVLFAGQSANAGAITFTGPVGNTNAGTGNAFFDVNDGPNGSVGSLLNTGGISVVGQFASLQNVGSNVGNNIVNNGMISIRHGIQPGDYTFANVQIDGTGVIRLQPNANLSLGREVGAGQTVIFEAGSGTSTLLLTSGASFNGTIKGFGASDTITVTSSVWDSNSYSYSNGVGTLTFTSAGTPVATLRFVGNYAQSDLSITHAPSGGQELTTITTGVPNQPIRVSFTDTDNGVSGGEAATPYVGPVAGLQYQYIWSSHDSVAISAGVPNVFLKGNAGGDALVANSGDNVLDGGGGSNFLVGGTGTGHDTFYVDGRGGVVTWSTVVNFHLGDQVTLFGFRNGTSTGPLTENDGTPGYTGVTVHSELNGAGTGVNESLTLTGLTAADFFNHMTVSTGVLGQGTASETPYLLIAYDH